jgi:hypothetical protein
MRLRLVDDEIAKEISVHQVVSRVEIIDIRISKIRVGDEACEQEDDGDRKDIASQDIIPNPGKDITILHDLLRLP